MPDRTYEGVLLACDLDGTLLDARGVLHPENLDALHGFLAAGGRFAVATGRSQASVVRNLPQLPSDLPGIFCNGAHLYDRATRTTVRAHPLPGSAGALIDDLKTRFPSVGLEIFTSFGAHLVRTCPVLRRQLAAEDCQDAELSPDEVPAPWLKLLIGGDPEELVPVRAHLEACCGADWSIVKSDAHLLDLMARGVSKGSALRELKALLEAERGGRRFRTVAVGDNENDLDMLRAADLAIVPENGTHGVRSHAHHVVAHHAEPVLPAVLRIVRDDLGKIGK